MRLKRKHRKQSLKNVMTTPCFLKIFQTPWKSIFILDTMQRTKQKCSPIQIDMFCKKFRSMLLNRKSYHETATIGKFLNSFIICVKYLLLGVYFRLSRATPILMRHLNNSVLFNLSAYIKAEMMIMHCNKGHAYIHTHNWRIYRSSYIGEEASVGNVLIGT